MVELRTPPPPVLAYGGNPTERQARSLAEQRVLRALRHRPYALPVLAEALDAKPAVAQSVIDRLKRQGYRIVLRGNTLELRGEPAPRLCPLCGAVMARDNRGKVCSPCRRNPASAAFMRQENKRPRGELRDAVLDVLTAHAGQRIDVWAELPAKLQSSVGRRAVQKQVDKLRAAGHEITAQRGGGGGYILQPLKGRRTA